MKNIRFSLLFAFLTFMLSACLEDKGYFQPEIELPVLQIDDVALEEGNSATVMHFKVTLVGNNFARVGVKYEVVDGDARAGSDFLPVEPGTLLFNPGEKEKTISVTLITNRLREPDEQFSIKLSEPVNATLEREEAKGTILNDDVLDVDVYIPGG